ncbi:hypothetical protein P3T76_008318 [Phytophthora citrophthora]|uniref:Uncharacterized protein n=1 Tax=Phytophthora citrophthora TaxID=4793 RepID=A0AAD9LKN7_9STRA|nr:hypothetical protein P3T76_008318 [Phytophthora citrophthora]
MASQQQHDNWLLVTLPKYQRNASSNLLPKIRESLTLLSIVAAVDLLAFCDILREHCGVDGNVIKFDRLRVIFALDDHTSRSLLWPEIICNSLLAWDGQATLNEDFLLAKEEVERISDIKLGKPAPQLDIPFCLHFAPRDINLVGLQQHLQSVRRVLKAVMPQDDQDNQDTRYERYWPFVFEAVQLNLRDFELNESVARALKDLVMLGANVSCLQLPLKSTDFLSEDECPRQPLADCFLAVTGGGPRSRLFSSLFTPERDRESPIEGSFCQVDTLVVNDLDIDDRRFAALCSALRGATGVRELVFESVFVQDALEARALKWKWLAYALFTPNGEKSSVKKLVITEPQFLAEDIAAIASVVNSHKPAQELLDPLWAEHEAKQRVDKSVKGDKDQIDQPEWEASNNNEGDDMVRLKKDTVLYLEPLCSQDEWLQSSVVLENDADFPIMHVPDNSEDKTEEWVEVLVPGYGKCWVYPDAARDRYSSSFYEYRGITELSLVTQVAKNSTDKLFIQFFQLIGHDLIDLTIQTNLLREQGLGSILRSCPNLRKLQLSGAQVEDMFAFTHGYDVGYCQIESLSIEHFRINPKSLDEFAKVLGDPDREATKHLRRLCIGKLRVQDIDIAVARYEKMIESFKRMLDTNNTLEYLKLFLEGDFYTRYVKSFTRHDGEQLSPLGVPILSKLALVSVLQNAGISLEEHVICRILDYAARQVNREICIMNY